MNVSEKLIAIKNQVAKAVFQVLQILRVGSFNRIASFIQPCISRGLLVNREFPTHFVVFLAIILTPHFGGAKHAFGSSFPIVTNPIKWHPGHYYTILNYGKNSSQYLSLIYDELQKTPALRGIQVNYRWAELEHAEGEYDFSSITQRLSELSSIKKRLVIVIDTKTALDSDEEILPAYLKTKEYAGGEFMIGYPDRNGRNLKLWNSAVRDRLSALIAALGKRFNSEAYFEGIGLSDTSIGEAYIPLTEVQREDYYANLLHMQQQIRNHFPNTLTFQFTSYPRLMLKTFIESLNEMGAGLGATSNSVQVPGPFSPIYPSDVYNYFPKLSGKTPLVVSVKYANYENAGSNSWSFPLTVPELLSYARDHLRTNYIFWTRHPEYYPKVLELLNFGAQRNNPSGGLHLACPSAYSACTN